MDELNVAGRKIGSSHPPYIVAEIGSNHNGDMRCVWLGPTVRSP